MGPGTELRDKTDIGRYLRERILPLSPPVEPIPFRGCIDKSGDPLPFFEDLDLQLRTKPGAIWNVMGPPGTGKTHLARWAAARWARRFLDDPEGAPAVLWIDAARLRTALRDDRALTGGPFAFALAADVSGETPESLAKLLTRHEFIAIVDKDEAVDLAQWQLELPMGLPPGLRILHLAIRDSMGGPCVRLDDWDRETALMAAHARLGPEGVTVIEALEASPAAALVTHPRFLGWLLERDGADEKAIASGAVLLEFLEDFYRACPGGLPSFAAWCEALLTSSKLITTLPSDTPPSAAARLAARRFFVDAEEAGRSPHGAVLHAALLAAVLRGKRHQATFEERIVGESELALLARLPLGAEVTERLLSTSPKSGNATVNTINLLWRVGRQTAPSRLLRGKMAQLAAPGYVFIDGISGLELEQSNLAGMVLKKSRVEDCGFKSCNFRQADFGKARVSRTKLSKCNLELADLSETVLKNCEIADLDLSSAICMGCVFEQCQLARVKFGHTEAQEPLQFIECALTYCGLDRLAPAGFSFERCQLTEVYLQNLAPRCFLAEKAKFERCDMLGLRAPGAVLPKAHFKTCILADVDLRGADLRGAKFESVEFQPGPASRAGLTEGSTRTDAMYGSKSGFYADDMSDGVYLDPDVVRTADLREADLRGATIQHTDLFRVDLRGAKLDPDLREKARRMRAFVEG